MVLPAYVVELAVALAKVMAVVETYYCEQNTGGGWDA